MCNKLIEMPIYIDYYVAYSFEDYTFLELTFCIKTYRYVFCIVKFSSLFFECVFLNARLLGCFVSLFFLMQFVLGNANVKLLNYFAIYDHVIIEICRTKY